MNPNDIPTFTGATGTGGGGQPPPASVSALTDSAASDLDAAETALLAFVQWLNEDAERSLCETDECANASIWDYAASAIKDLDKAEKNIVPVMDELFAQASDDLDRSRRAIESVGGRPIIMTDEAYGTNQASNHFNDAMERVIYPAIAQQEADALAPTTGADAPPLGEPPDVQDPTREPPIPIPGVNYPVPGQPEDPAPVEPGEPAEPGEPVDPPSPVPPPVSDPTSGVCCPSPEPPIVNVYVNVPGSAPLPVGTSPYPPPVSPGPPDDPDDGWSKIPYLPPEPAPPEPPVPPVVPPVVGGSGLDPIIGPIIQPKAGSFDGPNYCKLVNRCEDTTPDTGTDETVFKFIADAIGALSSAIPLIKIDAKKLRDDIFGFLRGLKTSVAYGANRNGIADPACVMTGLASTFFPKLLEKYTGVDLSYALEPQMQTIRHSSPVMIPPQGAIDAAYLGNKITKEEWECHTKALGNLPQIHWRAMLAGSRQMQINEAVLMRRRGIINQQQYLNYLRDDGVLELDVAQNLLRLTEYVPTPTEIFMWLSKDVANRKYVELANLDDGFADSWNDTFQRWADANGLTKEQILFEYRSQWKLPSKTQVDEMIRRLRPGRVPPKLAFTQEMAREVYKLDEVPEGFRDRLIATSYVPINRTDIMAAYVSGAMPEAEVFERLQDIGYSPADAQALTEFVKVKSEQQTQGSMGAWTRRRITTEYVQGSIPRAEAETLLGRTVLDPKKVQDALDDADKIRSALSRKQCIKAVKKRFLFGEFGEMTARNRLTNLGLDQVQANTIIDGWVCELNSKHKEPTVKMLTDWAKNGLISVQDLRSRLLNLGYSDDDSARIIRMAAIEDAEKRAKSAQQAADRAERKARQAARDREAAQKRAQGGG